MKQITCLVLCLCLLCVPLVFAKETVRSGVYDEMGVLTPSESEALEAQLHVLSEKKGIHAFFVLVDQAYYEGERFLHAQHIDSDADTVMVCITRSGQTYYFQLYTFGAAEKRITDREVEQILDAGMPIKAGRISQGLSGMVEAIDGCYQSTAAYFGKCFLISFCICAAFSIAIYVWVVLLYRRRNRGVSYPLESYTNLELTESDDRFMGTFVTKTRIPKPSSNSGGGSGRIGGGGGGFRGGR